MLTWLDASVLAETHGFDPFSTAYWPDAAKSKTVMGAFLSTSTLTNTDGIKSETLSANGAMPPPSSSTTTQPALAALSANTAVDTAKLRALRPETLGIAKETIRENRELTKASLEEILHKRVPGLTRGDARTVLATLAYPAGKGRARVWSLKEGV